MKSIGFRWMYHIILALCLLPVTACSQAKPASMPTLSFVPTALLAATSITIPTPVPQLPPVKVDQTGFTVEGKPFRFVGANAIYFGFYDQYGYSADKAIQSAKANGINVLRIYLGFGQDTWGGKPMQEYDQALDIAARNGMYVIAVLSDCCCMGGDWSQTEETYYRQVPYCNFSNPAGLEKFKKYINSILLRKNTANGKIYRDDTTLLAWDIVNEPFLPSFSDTELNNWLAQVTEYIKSVDPNHLLTFGLDASGSTYDTDGPSYTALNVPNLDFFSFHYNLPDFRTVSGHLEQIQFRVEKFLSMRKPVVLEEFGVGTLRSWGHNLDKKTMDKWVQAYKDQMDITFSAGGSGAMFWGWGVPETSRVPLWWRNEDHDTTETVFCDMLKAYQIPAPGSFQLAELPMETPNDNFDGSIFDQSRWQANVNGGGSIRQAAGRMVLNVADTEPSSNATVTSTWVLTGDFDIQIDFEIGEGWGAPAAEHLDGAAYGVTIGGQNYHITRLRTSTEDVFFGWSGDGTVLGTTPTSAVTGKYRLVRKGSDLGMFYDSGNGWQELAHAQVAAAPARVYFASGSVNASQSFTTYFDNILITSGQTNYRP